MSRPPAPGLKYEGMAKNGDRISLVRVPKTLHEPAHWAVTINGSVVAKPRTEKEGMDTVARLLAARQHGG